jgi:hypothetical protein
VRRLAALKLWYDIAVERLSNPPFDPEHLLRERRREVYEQEAIGTLTVLVDIFLLGAPRARVCVHSDLRRSSFWPTGCSASAACSISSSPPCLWPPDALTGFLRLRDGATTTLTVACLRRRSETTLSLAYPMRRRRRPMRKIARTPGRKPGAWGVNVKVAIVEGRAANVGRLLSYASRTAPRAFVVLIFKKET